MIAVVVSDHVNDTLYILERGQFVQDMTYPSLPGHKVPAVLEHGFKLAAEIPVTAETVIRIYILPTWLGYEAQAEIPRTGDMRIYMTFSALKMHGIHFQGELQAVDRDKNTLPLPPGIKRFYPKFSTAKSVAEFLNLYCRGKTVRQVADVFSTILYPEAAVV